MKTPQQIKDSCNICFISYLGIIAIIFALLCSGCAGTYYVGDDRPEVIYVKQPHNNWWWKVNKHHKHYNHKHHNHKHKNKKNKVRSHRK